MNLIWRSIYQFVEWDLDIIQHRFRRQVSPGDTLEMTVELGRTRKLIRDILGMGEGTIIELDKLAGEPVVICYQFQADLHALQQEWPHARVLGSGTTTVLPVDVPAESNSSSFKR